MIRGTLLRYPASGWAKLTFEQLLPGGHAIVFGPHGVAHEAEDAGFEVRDCLSVFGPQTHCVWLFRKSIQEKSIVPQVLKTGTGSLWIDGCRVSTGENLNGGAYSKGGRAAPMPGDEREGVARGMCDPGRKAAQAYTQPKGRWPANILFVHGPGCVREGTKRIPSSAHYTGLGGGRRPGGFVNTGAEAGSDRPSSASHADPDGLETVPAWTCQPGCSVAGLDQQSGVLHGPGNIGPSICKTTSDVAYGKWGKKTNNPNYHNDSGGASRFFPQFASETELDEWLLRLILGADP